MDNEYYELMIKDEADNIKKQMKNGKIYGQDVNMDNINHLIVAAYYAGFFSNKITIEKQLKDIFNNWFPNSVSK